MCVFATPEVSLLYVYEVDMKNNILNIIENTDIHQWELPHTENIFKECHSEVFTPYMLTKSLLDMLPENIWENIHLSILDVGCGPGYMSYVTYKYLFDVHKCRLRVLNMLYGIDNNILRLSEFHNALPVPIEHLKCVDVLVEPVIEHLNRFNIVVSNAPYIVSINGKKKTVWPEFIQQCMDYVKPEGYLCVIIPSIWMKPIHPMYSYFTAFNICSIKCLTNNEVYKWFDGNARTPLCYMCVQKIPSNTMAPVTLSVPIYDVIEKNYISCAFQDDKIPLPLYTPSIIFNRLRPLVLKYGSLASIIEKTNCPSKLASFSTSYDASLYKYHNISTCKIEQNEQQLCINYSNVPTKYSSMRKVVLANKMYGVPFYDKGGKYGLSTRDNYVYVSDDDKQCHILATFLRLKFIYVVYESARYRMGYLEKYAFEWIPNILNMNIDISDISDANIHALFGFTNLEIDYIENYVLSLKVVQKKGGFMATDFNIKEVKPNAK